MVGVVDNIDVLTASCFILLQSHEVVGFGCLVDDLEHNTVLLCPVFRE